MQSCPTGPLIRLRKPAGFAHVSHRLDAGNVETLAATHVLAGDLVVEQNHIALRLLELCAVAFVSAGWKPILLLPHQPAQIVRFRRPAEWALQPGGLGR